MRDAAQKDHDGVKAPRLSRAQKFPESQSAGLKQVSHKEIETVPHDGDREARAQAPGIVAARKYDDGNINQRLKRVKESKLRNDDRGYRQRYQEKDSSDLNPEAGRHGPG